MKKIPTTFQCDIARLHLFCRTTVLTIACTIFVSFWFTLMNFVEHWWTGSTSLTINIYTPHCKTDACIVCQCYKNVFEKIYLRNFYKLKKYPWIECLISFQVTLLIILEWIVIKRHYGVSLKAPVLCSWTRLLLMRLAVTRLLQCESGWIFFCPLSWADLSWLSWNIPPMLKSWWYSTS